MQNSSDKIREDTDERINEEEDSLGMTIEYLRARLLSERSISKAAKERADELVKRVEELEEQLKVVSFQRKRAEKAALDVLSYLDSLGIDDNFEVYECDSNEEESECESNMDNNEDKNFESSQNEGNESGSDHESTTPSGRSLSWKGRTQLFHKKFHSYSMHSPSSLSQRHSFPKHRLGKSCRKIKRRELRSTVVESTHDSGKSDAQESNFVESLNRCEDCLDLQNGKLKQSPEKYSERGSKKGEVSHSFQAQAQEQDYEAHNTIHEHECNGKMERALQHQAQLIKSYEAQEKAQRDWEEKYGESNESCEPGSHSDVTEERDENKVAVPHPTEADACIGHGEKVGIETNALGEKPSIVQFNSFKISPDANLGSSGKHNFSKKQSSASTPDFEFCVVDNNQSVEHVGHASVFYKPWPPQNISTPHALVPNKEPPQLGSVLEALHEAKQVIKRHSNSSGMRESVSKAIEISDPTNRDVDWLKLPVRYPGLFRVPTDLDAQASTQSSPSPSELSGSTLIPRTAGYTYISKPMDLTLPFINTPSFVSELDVKNRSEFFFPDQSSNEMYSQLQGNKAGKPPIGYESFQNINFRPNEYYR